MFDFDNVIPREGTDTCKFGQLKDLFGRTDLLPLWIADMDFQTPACVTEALIKRLEHPIYGYSKLPDNYWTVISQWVREHHQWDTQEEWYTFIPGIVRGFGLAINHFVKADEKVIIQPPVYHPFRLVSQGNGREVVYNPLKETADGRYEMDFDNLAQVCDDKCRLLILSNPHNPAGIVWSHETLARLADFCYDHHILVVSDEIHCDMALFGHKHTPFASVSEKAAHNSITFAAPSKTFNMAGVVSSFAIVPDQAIRESFYGWLETNELNHAHFLAPVGTMAAFEKGEPWRLEMLDYVEKNILYLEDYARRFLPGIKVFRPEASFLVWLDCRGLGLTHDALIDLFVNKARLALNDGAMFGAQGEGFMRLNVGTPRSILHEALQRLSKAMGVEDAE